MRRDKTRLADSKLSVGLGSASNINMNPCSICLDILYHSAKTLRCGHSFHKECIKKWKNSKEYSSKACPVCRCIFKMKKPNLFLDISLGIQYGLLGLFCFPCFGCSAIYVGSSISVAMFIGIDTYSYLKRKKKKYL